jgi:purine-nucleoside phosphorylase
MVDNVNKAVKFLKLAGISEIRGGISTGSGQALHLPNHKIILEIKYADIPGFEIAGIYGHTGVLQVISGNYGDWALWTGRPHHYQGYSFKEIGLYIEISNRLGAKKLICINAAGGLDPSLEIGNLVAIDKFRCFISIPGIEHAIDGGPFRMTSPDLTGDLVNSGKNNGIEIGKGNYAGVPGPTYETAAEVAWLRSLGCHVVGMSTVSELIYAQQLGMEIASLSSIANVHGKTSGLSHFDVVKSAELSAAKISLLISDFIGQRDM